jgi:hypothetical protein
MNEQIDRLKLQVGRTVHRIQKHSAPGRASTRAEGMADQQPREGECDGQGKNSTPTGES